MRIEPQVVSSMKMYGYIYILEENILLITGQLGLVLIHGL